VPRRPNAPKPFPHAELSVPVLHLDRDVPIDVARSRLARGEWLRVRRGAYVAVRDLDPDEFVRRRQLALSLVSAVSRQSRLDAVVSHASSALVWGLPLYRLPERTHVVQAHRRAGNAAPDVARHLRGASEIDAVERRGVRVTTLARTVLDCAQTLGARGGLVVADAALAGGVTRQECEQMLERLTGARGVRTARAVIEHADEGAESPGESLTRCVLLAAGLPAPQTQVAVATHLGTFWADIGWPEWRLLIEFDGAVKYGAEVAAVLLDEKRRQGAIEEAGWRMVRVVAADLRDPAALLRRVSRSVPAGILSRLEPRRMLAS
jgi:hypothetical protein